MKQWLGILAILAFVGLLYARIPSTYFCGYDDFNENNRAAFEERKEPLRLLTATHFNSYKYRPLSHTLHYATYWLGHGNPAFFRIRNVIFHLLNVLLVYGIGMLLFRNWLTSAGAALLFGVHPLANQPVVAASFTITAAHVGFLFAVFCFLYSLRKKPESLPWLCLGLLSGWLSLLTYESSISVFVLMFGYLFIQFVIVRELPVSRKYLLVLVIGTVLLVGSYFGMRRMFVTVAAKQAVPTVKTLVASTMMYAGALVSPMDSVLANHWFGTPLPSEVQLSSISSGWKVVFLVIAIIGVIGLASLVKVLMNRLNRHALAIYLFLLSAIILSLLPLIVFTPKPSETYMYLAVAFGALLFSAILNVVVKVEEPRGRAVFAGVFGVLAISFSCATWVRNGSVASCGQTAKRIMGQLQEERFQQGAWSVWLAAAPGEPKVQRYGIYRCRGIETIGASGIESAVRVANNNEALSAHVVDALSPANCEATRAVCLLVHDDGSVVEMKSSRTAQ
ncbi:MAG: hypothetical protein ACR2LM_10010 [Pyrinomonadaceae bacterium]